MVLKPTLILLKSPKPSDPLLLGALVPEVAPALLTLPSGAIIP